MATLKYPTIPHPTHDPLALNQTAMALKETVEILTATRGERLSAAVTWQDLIDLGLITPAQVPPTLGPR
jgi:hypothetical protein